MAISDDWQDKEYSFFSHKKCECFPCHEGVDPDNFNCLFCYCPLYAYGDKCGGQFTYTKDGIKSCEKCPVPHIRKNYGHIVDKFIELRKTVK